MNLSLLRTRWAAVGAAVAVTLGAGGLGISFATSPAGAVAFVPITPCRVLDTRPAPDNVGNRATPIGAEEAFTVDAHGDNGDCTGIPSEATGLSLNVTALGATSGTFLTLWAADATQPTASNLNPQPGQPPTPNAVTTGISATGQFNIFNKVGTVDVIVDVVGYYADHQHTGADIVDNSLTAVDIQNEPGIADGFTGFTTTLTALPATVGSAVMRVPADGFVKVEVTAQYRNSNTAGSDALECQIQKGDQAAFDFGQPYGSFGDLGSGVATWNSFSMHRILPVAAADNPSIFPLGQVFRVICIELAGGVLVGEVYVSATYFSTSYEPAVIPGLADGDAAAGDIPPPDAG